jgi:hypothetical protein
MIKQDDGPFKTEEKIGIIFCSDSTCGGEIVEETKIKMKSKIPISRLILNPFRTSRLTVPTSVVHRLPVRGIVSTFCQLLVLYFFMGGIAVEGTAYQPQSRQSARLSLQSSALAPPTLSSASGCCPPPPFWFRGGTHSLAGRGRGEPIRTKGQTLRYSRYSTV